MDKQNLKTAGTLSNLKDVLIHFFSKYDKCLIIFIILFVGLCIFCLFEQSNNTAHLFFYIIITILICLATLYGLIPIFTANNNKILRFLKRVQIEFNNKTIALDKLYQDRLSEQKTYYKEMLSDKDKEHKKDLNKQRAVLSQTYESKDEIIESIKIGTGVEQKNSNQKSNIINNKPKISVSDEFNIQE